MNEHIFALIRLHLLMRWSYFSNHTEAGGRKRGDFYSAASKIPVLLAAHVALLIVCENKK